MAFNCLQYTISNINDLIQFDTSRCGTLKCRPLFIDDLANVFIMILTNCTDQSFKIPSL